MDYYGADNNQSTDQRCVAWSLTVKQHNPNGIENWLNHRNKRCLKGADVADGNAVQDVRDADLYDAQNEK